MKITSLMLTDKCLFIEEEKIPLFLLTLLKEKNRAGRYTTLYHFFFHIFFFRFYSGHVRQESDINNACSKNAKIQ